MNRSGILRRVRKEFAPELQATAMSHLDQYASVAGDSPYRVQHAVLKLAAGNLAQLAHYVEAAKADFRDVLYWAYYPEEASVTPEQAAKSLERLEKAGLKVKKPNSG